ncbi:uncharacterized protein [Procambarus clarkii]|uniref:uncharacterized protein n=1 Tax=Procambarus clarkii TaxID=6728 RepID=UPI0037424B7D
MNKTNKVLQSKDVNILVATNLPESMKSYLQETRDKFSVCEFKARSMCPDTDYSDGKKRERKRSVRLSRYDGSAEEVPNTEPEKFKLETFLPILDTLIFELTKPVKAYSQIGNLFSFFSDLKTTASDAQKKKWDHLANMYHKDLNYDDLLNEYEHLKHNMVLDGNCDTLPALYRKLILDSLRSVFLNVENALREFMCMMVTDCTGERSFSRIKL